MKICTIYLFPSPGQEKTNQMMGSIGDKAQAAKEKTQETAHDTKEKNKGAAQQARDKASEAAHKTGEKAQAGKEKSSGILQQTGEQVKHMAQKTADAVKSTFGMAKTGEEQDMPTAYDKPRE